MRLFVSIDLPSDIQKQLDSWLPTDIPGIKKTDSENLHLTLQFLGKCNPDHKDVIINKLKLISFEPFSLVIDGVGVFPSQESPRVIWGSIAKNDNLMKLQQIVSEELIEFLYEHKKRAFRPHITLGRVEKDASMDFLKLLENKRPIHFDVNFFTLKRSILKPEGAQHKILWKFESNVIRE